MSTYLGVIGTDGKVRNVSDSNGYPVSLTGSNVEQTIGSAIPSKANLMGISDGANIRAFSGNLEGTLLASAARTTGPTTAIQKNYNAKGVIIYLNITAASGTGGLRVFIQMIDPVSGSVTNINAAPTAIIATGLYTYAIYPSMSSGATQATSGVLPRSWNVWIQELDASSYTYSLGYSLML